MTQKTNMYPTFTRYGRRNNEGKKTETGGIDYLLVPDLLLHSPSNPLVLMRNVNDLEICNLIDGELIPDIEKTNEGKTMLIIRSPRIMTTRRKKLYVKSGNLRFLNYDFFFGESPIETHNRFDYVAGKEAAGIYTKLVGICSMQQLMVAEKEGKLNFFWSESDSHIGSNEMRRNMKLYLVEEINKL